MFKYSLIIISLFSLLSVGCSSDEHYRREIEGNDNYLKSPPLQPLIVPNDLNIPLNTGEYDIARTAREGALGKNLDIRPPMLPINNLEGGYVNYEDDMVKFDIAESEQFWSKIPSVLQQNNISIVSSDSNSIKTGIKTITNEEKSLSVDVSYLLKLNVMNGREYIDISLDSVKQNGEISIDSIDKQYYLVDFFDMLMNQAKSSDK